MSSSALTAVLGVLCLLNIALTLVVIRKLGTLQARPAAAWPGPAASDAPPMAVRPGALVGEFVAPTTDGDTVTRADLTGIGLVAFLAPGCQACDFAVPGFVERAELLGRDHVIAVLMGDSPMNPELTERLAPVARVLVEEQRGPLVEAFGVLGLPAFAQLTDARMVLSAATPEELPEPVTS